MTKTVLPGKAAVEENAMVRGEDGEFELILGNRQLLSVFFIVVALLGVFFTMGYIVGKNAGSSDVLAAKREPLVVDPSAPHKEPSGGTLIDPRTEGKAPLIVETPSPTETKREPAPPKHEVASKEPPRKEEPKVTPKSEPKPVASTPDPPRKQASLTSSGEPAPGQTFLQVVASTRPDCEMIAGVLKGKGFAASVVPGPNETIFRVLVGPLPDSAAVSKARADLEAVGFQKPIVRKY